jgi:carboxymethylenebutenolidase
MKTSIILILFSILLIGCQPVQDIDHEMLAGDEEHMSQDIEEHIGCQPAEVVEGTCTIAPEGEKNKDLFTSLDSVDVDTEEVNYYDDITGYFAKPSDDGKYPGVVMIHEWWGLNDNIKDMARLLANEGYLVLAVDLYGEVATESADAGRLAGAARKDVEGSNANMKAAAAYLKNHPQFSGTIASMGWCFGGQQSLNLALSGEKMDATVIYYGSLTDDENVLSQITWPVLGIFGEEDTGIPPAAVNAFKAALDNLEIQNDITIYEGVGHAFANPSGSRYAAAETLDAWSKTVEFLGKELNQ